MRHVYACHLRFRGDPASTCPRARAVVRHVAAQPYGGWPADCPPAEGSWAPAGTDASLRWELITEGSVGSVFRLTVERPLAGDPTMRWVETAIVGGQDRASFAFLQVSLNSTTTTLTGTVSYSVTPHPAVVDLVNRLDVRDARRTLSMTAVEMAPATLATLVSDPGRQRPVVAITASAHGDGLEPGAVAYRLAGLAHVCTLDGPGVTEVAGLLGPDSAPRPGDVMLWWPGWHPADARRHVIRWAPWEQASPFGPGDPLFRTVFAASAFRLSPPDLFEPLRRAAARRRISQLEEQLRSDTAVDLATLLEGWEADLTELDVVRSRLDERDRELGALRAERDGLRAALAERSPAPPPSVSEEPPPTLLAALQRAAATCRRVRVLPAALESAARSEFPRPREVLDDLVTLDGIAQRWAAEELPEGFAIACRQAGLAWKPDISDTAKTRYGDRYCRTYRGREVMLGPHLSYGGGSAANALVARVYCYLDKEARMVVVGHAGEHLPDTHYK